MIRARHHRNILLCPTLGEGSNSTSCRACPQIIRKNKKQYKNDIVLWFERGIPQEAPILGETGTIKSIMGHLNAGFGAENRFLWPHK